MPVDVLNLEDKTKDLVPGIQIWSHVRLQISSFFDTRRVLVFSLPSNGAIKTFLRSLAHQGIPSDILPEEKWLDTQVGLGFGIKLKKVPAEVPAFKSGFNGIFV
jgi:hypothetical protein